MQDAFGVERGLVSKKDRGGPGWDSDDAIERYQRNVKADGSYVSRQGTRRAKNWGVLGGYTAGGAALGGAVGAPAGGAGAAVGAIGGGLGGAVLGAAHNEARSHQRAFKVATTSGDIREPRKGERTSEFHGGKIVPKKEYKKAQLKFLKKENASLRTELGKGLGPVSKPFKPVYRSSSEANNLVNAMMNHRNVAHPAGSSLRQRLFSSKKIDGISNPEEGMRSMSVVDRPLLTRPGVAGSAAVGGTGVAAGGVYAAKKRKRKG